MVNCPACEQEVNEDFGMVTCPHCKAVFMVDYGGGVQYGTEEKEEESGVEDDDFVEPTNIYNAISEEAEGELEKTPESVDVDSFLENDEFIPDENEEESEEEVGSMEPNEVIVSDFQSDLDSGEETVSAFIDEDNETDPLAAKKTLVPDNEPVDITKFANSEDSLLEDGEYLYTVMIARIDSKELRNDLKYVLMDEKLKLNHHEHLKNIVAGRLSIPDLHPIKAKRIVEQLQFFDLEVRWVQKRVIIEEALEEAIYEDSIDDE